MPGLPLICRVKRSIFGTVNDDLQQLATVNHHGFAFLLAYGLTWLLAAIVWNRAGERLGAYAVLFQGVLALPVAFGLMALTSAGPRPDNPLLDQLSTTLAVSQVFALPVLIYLIIARSYRNVAVVLGAVTIVHFAPYSWLYQTPLYLVLAGVLAIGLFIVCRLHDRSTEKINSGRGAWTIPAFVGCVLVIGSVVAYLL